MHKLKNLNIDNLVDDILLSMRAKKLQTSYSACRSDVINKNILRIISRFLKGLLKQYIPGYTAALKTQEKTDEMLNDF